MSNQIPKNWQKVKLEDITLQICRGFQPSYTEDDGLTVINQKCIRDGKINFEEARLSDLKKKSISADKYLEILDILINSTGTGTVGRVGQLINIKSLLSFDSHVTLVRPDKTKVDGRYLGYKLWQLERLFENLAEGSTNQVELGRDRIRNLEILLPSLSEQGQIAPILSAFDDKIEVNNKIAKTLEEIPQAIFKEWFSRSEEPEGKLSDIAEIKMGQSPPSEFYNSVGNGLPFHQGVTNFGNRFPKHEVYCTQNNRIAEAGDLLFSVRAPVGRINIADTKISLGRGVASIRHKNGYQSYLYYLLKRLFKKEDSLGGGSVFPAVTKDEMEGMKIMLPNDQIIEKFEKIVRDMDKKIEVIEKENQRLVALRDLLLPKLMSGEVRL